MADDFATEVATPTVNAVGHGGHHKADISEYANSAEVNLQNKLYWMIDFVAVATNKCVNFPAFITEYSDNYTSNWNEEQAYGRMDPIQLFKNTQRQISLSWTVIATSVEMGKKNLHKFEHLSSMLYPTYEEANKVTTMAAAPLLKIKFTNLIKDRMGGEGPAALAGGLLGVVTGFNFSPNLDAGFLTDGPGRLYPKEYSVSTQFSVLHTHDLGWLAGTDPVKWRAGRGLFGEDELTGNHSTCPLKGSKRPPSRRTKAKRDGFTGGNTIEETQGAFAMQNQDRAAAAEPRNTSLATGEAGEGMKGQRQADAQDRVAAQGAARDKLREDVKRRSLKYEGSKEERLSKGTADAIIAADRGMKKAKLNNQQ